MKRSLLLGIAATAGLCGAPALAQQASTTAPSTRSTIQPIAAPENGVYAPFSGVPVSGSAQPAPLTLRNGAVPTGLHGFYDYQSNGMLRGRIFVPKNNSQKIYTAYMLSLQGGDTAQMQTTRRVGYAYSNDGGANWQSTNEIQTNFRLGFPYIDVTAGNVPYIATHGDPDGQGARTLMYKGEENSTSFTRTGILPRVSFTGASGDEGAGVIWPAFVIDPKEPTKQVITATLSPPTGGTDEPVHFIHNNLGMTGEWDVIGADEITYSSGGRNILATSSSGKVGLAYYHGDDQGGSGVYFVESNDGGGTWGTPVRVMHNGRTYTDENLNGDEDTVFVGFNLDLVYNGDDPMIVASGSVNGLYARNAVYMWTQEEGFREIVRADSTKMLGITRAFPQFAQPNMSHISYPGISVGDDGRHIVVSFSAAAQAPFSDDGSGGESAVSEFGFHYFRVWAIGSPDGGNTWGEPRILQDFGGTSGDSASIEYPAPAAWGKVTNNSFEHQMVFQARRQPGMTAFVVADIDGDTEGDQPAARGPFDDATNAFWESYHYFQRTTLDPTFFGEPASVGGSNDRNAAMKIAGSYPNPATGAVTVRYELGTTGKVSLKLYDMLGAEVLAPVNGEHGFAGEHTRTLDVASLPAGQYRMVLSQNGHSVSQPLNVVR